MPMMQNPYMSGAPVDLAQFQQPQGNGLMANPSSFQFLSAMMNQPGGFNPAAIPGYGTDSPFGVPMYLPQHQSPRSYSPPPAAAPSGDASGGWSGASFLIPWVREAAPMARPFSNEGGR